MKLYLFIVTTFLMCLLLQTPQGCHRRKRSVGYQTRQRKGAKEFMSSCIPKLLKSKPDYSGSDWSGPVSYTIYHSQWYESVDMIACAGGGDTVDCWVNNLREYISDNSPALRATQVCVKLYYDQYTGQRSKKRNYPSGYKIKDAATCGTVDDTAYKNEFLADVNSTELGAEDDCISNFDSVIEFAKRDMICRDCPCTYIYEMSIEKDLYEYNFADGKPCGDCWTSRLASGTRGYSKLRRPAARQAIKRAGLKKKLRPRTGHKTGTYYMPGFSK